MAQDDLNEYKWWYDLHGYPPEGTRWQGLMDISPCNLGPNALPIPHQTKAHVDSLTAIKVAFESHNRPGDHAQDLYVGFNKSFAKNKISLRIYGIIFEHYKTSVEVRNEMMSREKDCEATVAGDFYFESNVLLLGERRWWPNITVRLGCKTASGGLDEARYSDTPAYWFDSSVGKNYNLKHGVLRPYISTGFYCWQTTDNSVLQNDALMYGVGLDYSINNWTFSNCYQGYNGWNEGVNGAHIGDHPTNYRLHVSKTLPKHRFGVEYQHGITDVLYKTVRIEYTYIIKCN